MADEWVSSFRHFSLSVDNVDSEAFEHTKELVADYLQNSLETCHYEILLDGTTMQDVDGDEWPALSTEWATPRSKHITVAIQGGARACSSLTACCYVKRKPLWINSENGGLLKDAESAAVPLVDSWSRQGELPPYRDYGESVARTSIVFPLEYGPRVFGVLNLEFEDSLPITDNGRETVRTLGNSLARLFWLHQTFSTTTRDTLRAFEVLERLPTAGISPLKRRTVFLSSPEHADPAVMEAIHSVLGEFEDLFEVKFWKEESLSGDVKQQVRDAIISAEFGVCYLSQQIDADSSAPSFVDNYNVVFEAGMLQAMHEIRRGRAGSSRWVPIREVPPFTTPPPFNFATDRLVEVPREEGNGRLQASELAQRLRATIEAQVEGLDLKR